eukprot:5926298-Amphidinium_carterae.1
MSHEVHIVAGGEEVVNFVLEPSHLQVYLHGGLPRETRTSGKPKGQQIEMSATGALSMEGRKCCALSRAVESLVNF